jgi:hypothetical protein
MKTINRDTPPALGGFPLSPTRSGIGTRLLFFASLIYSVSCLIDDPVSQRTILKQYQPSVMYEHTFFDMSILDAQSLVQADSNATYFLAKQCKEGQPHH